MPIRVAAAPCSYGVFEITVDRPGLPDGARLARVMAEAGYVGTELGPPGYFGEGAAVRDLLTEHGLVMVGSFLPLRFSRAGLFEQDFAALGETLDMLDVVAGDSERPVILLADAFCEPDRMQFAGFIEKHPEAWLDAERFRLLIANLERAARHCRDRGFPPSLHYHAGTYVETPREIGRVVDALDPELLGLCFDTGHSAFGGGDPLALLKQYGELVTHVHFKDVDLARLEAVQASGGDLLAAWEQGVFCRLGTGDARVDDCLGELRSRNYSGWIVVEQDRVLAADEPFSVAVDDAAKNRAWLSERGL